MDQAKYNDPVIQQIEHLLSILKNERARQMSVTRPTIRPIHSWDEQTRHLRFAEKVKLHRYPGGFANTTRWRREQMLAAHRRQLEGLDEPAVVEATAIHEAVAYALDAERFLGSLDQRDERDYFPVGAVDALAEHLLVWLRERGYQVSRLQEE